MSNDLRFNIPRYRAEYPMLIVGAFFIFAGWAVHYGFFDKTGGLIWLGITLPIYFILYFMRRGDYFVQVNSDGIGWRKDILSKYIYLPWRYLHRVDYLVYEINFTVKETGQVVCFPTSGLSEAETDALKQRISDVVKEKMEKGEL